MNDCIPKKEKGKKIRNPIKIKESEEIEKAAKKLEMDRIENKNEPKNTKLNKKDYEDIEDTIEDEENTTSKDYDDEGLEKKSRRKEMNSDDYEDNDEEIDTNRKKYREEKYEKQMIQMMKELYQKKILKKCILKYKRIKRKKTGIIKGIRTNG